MEKNWGEEIERIDAELVQIKKKILDRYALADTEPPIPTGGKDVLSPEGHAQLTQLRNQLVAFTDATHETGGVAYAGTFESCGRQSIWAKAIQTDYLLTLNNQRRVEKVLASIGNSQRLGIVLALLKQPMTVVQLVDVLEAHSTGLIYHHLKPLLLADLIYEENGVYGVKPHRIQGIMMVLAGVWDLVDPRYTSGSWEEEKPA
jgi:Bacterial regulatory protein, arsR family